MAAKRDIFSRVAGLFGQAAEALAGFSIEAPEGCNENDALQGIPGGSVGQGIYRMTKPPAGRGGLLRRKFQYQYQQQGKQPDDGQYW